WIDRYQEVNGIVTFQDDGLGGWVGFNIYSRKPTVGLRGSVIEAGPIEHFLSRDMTYSGRRMWLVLQMGFDSVGGNLFFRINQLELTAVGAAITAPTINPFRIGWCPTAFVPFFLGRIAEVLFYDGKYLSDAERTSNYEALLERVNGPIAITTPDTTISKTVHSLPDDGNGDRGGMDWMCSGIWSTADKIFVTSPVEVDAGNMKTRIYRFNKTWVQEQGPVEPWGNQAKDDGHRASCIGVDEDGQVHTHKAVHNETWDGEKTAVALDITTFVGVVDPTGGDILTYTGHIKNPNDETLYLHHRGNALDGSIWKWNSGAGAWQIVANQPLVKNGLDSPYGLFLRFDPSDANKWYVCMSFRHGGAGGPWKDLSVIYSPDAGANWETLADGVAIVLPADMAEADIGVPNVETTTDGDKEGHDMVVGPDGVLHMVCAWKNELANETQESLWYLRFDPTGRYFHYHRLLQCIGADDIGTPKIIYAKGGLHIIAPQRWRVVTTSPVYVFSSWDGGDTWRRYVLHDDGVNNMSEFQLDREAARLDDKIRMLPWYYNDETILEAWEFDPPVARRPGVHSGTAGVLII
ncbi:BNR repeat-containing protein, partial [Patescibacteria group bacterium]|nr:BNR repeat-containing protein [Patescibacteria group bacterium]